MRTRPSFELSLEKVEWMLEQSKLGQLKSIKVIKKGVVNPTYEINNKYILRIHQREPHLLKLEKEAAIYERVLKSGVNVPVPRVIALDTSKTLIPHNYVLMNKIRGTDLDEVWKKLGAKKKKDISFHLGKTIAELHKIRFRNFGGILPAEKRYPSWDAYIQHTLADFVHNHRNYGDVPNYTLDAIEQFYKKNRHLLKNIKQPVLLHGDWHRENIKIHGNKISGVFDFEWALAGHNEFDFKNIMPQSKKEKLLQEGILSGYQTVHTLPPEFETRIRLYIMMNCLDFLEANYLHWGNDPNYRKKYLMNIEKELEE
ncbi:MAG: aminoglycoside phosphotransferase family protein [Candidatus Woesearchaeota archaeon]|nr:aminoglycoside phosphotransferase family protein [Candidatus Woesearchaeota archaeon]